jgi:hypothetical protein
MQILLCHLFTIEHKILIKVFLYVLEELIDEEKPIVAEVFEKDMNKKMFMKQKNLNVCLIWLRRKIRYAYFHCLRLHSENKSEETQVIFCHLRLAVGLHPFEC